MTVDPRLIAATHDRGWLLDAYARGLSPGDHIVALSDAYVATGETMLEAPLDSAAEVLFVEPPRVEPGARTTITSYLRVRDRRVRILHVRRGILVGDAVRVARAERSWSPAP